MDSATFHPCHDMLKNLVHSYWTLSADGGAPTGCTLIPPEPVFDFILHFGAPTVWDHGTETASMKHGYVGGLRHHAVNISATGSVRYFAIRFFPWGLAPFLSFPLSELRGRVLTLDDLGAPLSHELYQRVGEAESDAARHAVAESILVEHLRRTQAGPSALALQAVQQQQQASGTLSVERLSRALAVTPRSLERCFARDLGMSPKGLMQLIRFDALRCAMEQTAGQPDWMDLVVRFGFHDQAHLVKSFARFTGHAPSAYLSLMKAWSSAA